MITDMLCYSATADAYVADYGTVCRVDMGNVGVTDAGLDKSPRWISIAHGFQGRSWVLVPVDQRQGDQAIVLRVILLTNAARELARIVDVEPMPEYQQAVADFFEQKGFHMLEIDFGTSNTP